MENFPVLKSVLVIGGGAAGFFFAINLKLQKGDLHVTIIEKQHQVLSKVKVSGGGRCNVTNAITDPKDLAANYPRGRKELLGAFHQFGSKEAREWFSNQGVETKVESDGRVFPASNTSDTIIQLFIKLCEELNIEIIQGEAVKELRLQNNQWEVQGSKNLYISDFVMVGTGSSNVFWKILKDLGLKIVDPVPSLFTFNVENEKVKSLSGVSLKEVVIRTSESKEKHNGPLLFTHWGVSGPAILKTSSFQALKLQKSKYQFLVYIQSVLHTDSIEIIKAELLEFKEKFPNKSIAKPLYDLPKRFWIELILENINKELWQGLSKGEIETIANRLLKLTLTVSGKSTFKEEFVTAGGVSLKEIDFKRMNAKKFPNLYFGGEVLNIDAITGGFNFQSAWTTAYIAAKDLASKV